VTEMRRKVLGKDSEPFDIDKDLEKDSGDMDREGDSGSSNSLSEDDDDTECGSNEYGKRKYEGSELNNVINHSSAIIIIYCY